MFNVHVCAQKVIGKNVMLPGFGFALEAVGVWYHCN